MNVQVLKSLPARRFLLLLLLFQLVGYAQVNFTQSNLPIVIINTDNNAEIPDDPKIQASMKIIYHADGTTNYLTDQNTTAYLNYSGRIKIEVRGSTSQDLPKKQYGWTTYESDNSTKKKVSILGMPKQNDWILNGLAFDPSLIRDYLSYNLSRAIGYYTVRTQFCEVVLNGSYNGLYILQEKLKDDENRINIEAIDDSAANGVALTGGYITKADKTTGGDPVAWSMQSYVGNTDFIHELPKPEDVTSAQDAYIHQQFTNLAGTSHNNNSNFGTGYPSIIDIPTFVDFMIMSELAGNVDSYQVSTYFHKDIGGKLRAGPIWDFNLTFGNDLFSYGYNRGYYNVWQFANGDNEGPKFWRDLFDTPDFRCYFSRRWNELTQAGQPLNYDKIVAAINTTTATIADAAAREQARWGTVPNFNGEVDNIKNWLLQRSTWITNNAGSYTACQNPVLPSLVITDISYHPSESSQFPESDDQEFFAIKNTGTTVVNLTGVYLRELGTSYQFPVNSTIAAGETYFIAGNATVFQQKYGFVPFGEFQRTLSNSTQNIVLADGMGNIIDTVQYDDETPWPDADGNGMYLHLTATNLDNSLAASWEAVSEASLGAATFKDIAGVVLYPNPVSNILNVTARETINGFEMYNIYGKLLQSGKPETDRLQIQFSGYAAGIYFVKIETVSGSITKKVVKQ
ncbi:CotH kinase family protein [Flavobacterium psychrotrophum]|uniref:CotH kinase family protein n=1 Tax=Flavobacterium psychrotrophum TaxID=2294119 RepID=UPI000E31CAA6|nr:CotH kinase family protein [Flavobacterium psychrotrophum]